MANRDNHYEAAFEEYLRARQLPYVAVDEAKRSLLADGRSIKNLDFIVSSPGPTTWLVDVKGRRFPWATSRSSTGRTGPPGTICQSLAQWEALSAERFAGLFVFAYNIVGDRAPLPAEQLFEFRGALYGFVAVRLSDYAAIARPISPALGHGGHADRGVSRIGPADARSIVTRR